MADDYLVEMLVTIGKSYGKSDTQLELFACLNLVEQAITLLGQADINLLYTRRLGVYLALQAK